MNTVENNLPVAENELTICGYLAETDLKQDDEAGVIKGSLTIRVGEDDETADEVTIQVYQNKLTTKKKPNSAYSQLIDIKNNWISLAACGGDKTKATRVSCYKASLEEKVFMSKNGNLVFSPNIRCSFFNEVRKSEFIPALSYVAKVVVGSFIDEIKNNVPTGRTIMEGYLCCYGGVFNKVDFIIENPQYISYITSHWKEGDTVMMKGSCRFRTSVENIEIQTGFGDPILEPKTIYVREFLVESGSPMCLEPELSYSADDISVGLQNRTLKIEKAKEKAKTSMANTNAFPTATTTNATAGSELDF